MATITAGLTDTSISRLRLIRYLDELSQTRGLPDTLVCDNSPEFASKAKFFWAWERGVQLHFIQPGKPTQNAFIESLNGKFRGACLNQHWFRSVSRLQSFQHALPIQQLVGTYAIFDIVFQKQVGTAFITADGRLN